MNEPAKARFAVGDFKSWDAVAETLGGLRSLGVKTDAISFLGSRQHFVDGAAARLGAAPEVRELTYRRGPNVVCCTPGVLAERLAGGPGKDAGSLGDALSRWLMPEAARRIQRSIDDGVLLMWVQIFDADDERRACTGLLTYCLSGVEVHDFVPSRPAKGNGRSGTMHFPRKF